MKFPILGQLKRGTTQRHLIQLPGAALADDEPRPVITVSGAHDGPTLFVNAGVHGGEYPAIEAVIRLGKLLDPHEISGTVVLMPVLNLPAFRSRTPFVCPVDNVNPNRVFPGDAEGSYSEQMTHAIINEFVAHADAWIDLHGGDIPEDLVPFAICRGGDTEIDRKSKEMAVAFGLPYVLTISKPVQQAKGVSSYVAGAERGVPSILAEAGGTGRLEQDAVEMLVNGVVRLMGELGMIGDGVAGKDEARMTDAEGNPKREGANEKGLTARSALATEGAERFERRSQTAATILTGFEWVYAQNAGIWYSRVKAGDLVTEGQEIGRVGDLFGDALERIVAPVSGTVLFLTINPSVQANGLLMGIGVEQ